jgi:hypothetical protein
MMERMMQWGVPGRVNTHSNVQIAHMKTWGNIPDPEMTMAALHIIHVQPKNGITETHVNPIDPYGDEGGCNWVDTPYTKDRVIPAGRW